MNANLTSAIHGIGKVEAIMHAIESSYLTIEFVPEERERAEHAVNAFYALWDAVKNVENDLEKLAYDEKVVDVIYAVNDVRKK